MKNFIVAALNPVLMFLMPLCTWTPTQPHFKKHKMAAKSIGTAKKTGSKTNFQFGSKTIVIFCNLIGDLKLRSALLLVTRTQ